MWYGYSKIMLNVCFLIFFKLENIVIMKYKLEISFWSVGSIRDILIVFESDIFLLN